MRGTPRAGIGRGDDARCPTSQHTRRQEILRLPRPQILLPDRNLAAPLRQRLPNILRFRESAARHIASGMDAQAQPPLRIAQDGESFSARSLDRLAPRDQHAGGAILFPAIVISALRVAALTVAYVF